MSKPPKIAVLTSGGDAPGMNAAIRAIARAGTELGAEVVGVRRGFRGLIDKEFLSLGRREVGGILQLGGTMLGSSRCAEFMSEAGRRRAIDSLESQGVSTLIVIGGNGSQTGAHELERLGFPVIGVASTIDNDLVGSDFTIGFDSAVGVALEAIDRLRATATSHRRVLIVEVMGRNSGHIALHSAIAGGAEVVVLPEVDRSAADILRDIGHAYEAKGHAVAVVAEGSKPGTTALVEQIEQAGAEQSLSRVSARATVLGYVQRGVAPSLRDRILASQLGVGAVRAAVDGRHGVLVGLIDGAIHESSLVSVAGRLKPLDHQLLEMAQLLSR